MAIRDNQYRVEYMRAGRCKVVCEKLVSKGSSFIRSSVARLLFCIDMPDDIVGETNHFVACSFGHFGESFGLGLILERITWEVDAYRAMLVSIKVDKYIHN